MTLKTLPPMDDEGYGQLAKTGGFSLHAGVFADSHQDDKLEKLCRYISRPSISTQRLSMTSNGQVRYALKTPYKDGTTHVFFSPTDFIGKLAALVPPPKLNLIRFYGVFAPNSHLRAQVTASKRGKHSPKLHSGQNPQADKPKQAKSVSWAQRLKRVFNIEISQCKQCEKHKVRIFACITQPGIIKKILTHLDKQTPSPVSPPPALLPPPRAPPSTQSSFDWGA